MSSADGANLAVAAAGIVVNIIGLIFVGVQVRRATVAARIAAVEQEEEHERRRRKETIEAVTATSALRERLKNDLPWNDRDMALVEAFLDEAEGNRERMAPVRAYLDYLEMLAVGVNAGVFDLDTFSRISGSRVLAVWTNYAGYIERRRKELNSPTLYSELGNVAASVKRLRGQE